LFNVGDYSKSNYFKKRGNDVIQTTSKDLLEVLFGPIARSRGKKKLNYAFNGLIQSIWAKMNFKEATTLTSDEQTIVNLIYVQNRGT
jgi:hypothetical protein